MTDDAAASVAGDAVASVADASAVASGADPSVVASEADETGPPGAGRVFVDARTAWRWTDRPVEDGTLRALFDLAKLGPTSANCSPARFLFLRSVGSKLRLRAALSAGNVERALAAPVVAIVASDPDFHAHLPRLYPEADARAWFAGNPTLADETAHRNATLQGAYLIVAARMLGLDCGPMSGFDNGAVDRIFLQAQGWRSEFLVCLGHADRTDLPPRAPRLEFDEACTLM